MLSRQKYLWFQKLTGIPEKKWDFNMKSLPNPVPDPGKFQEICVGTLKKQKLESKTKNKPLKVFVRDTFQFEELFDTSCLQVSGPNKAMYQVASNFNALELASYKINPFNGHYLSNLMSDSTQGPSASAGAGQGAILRLSLYKKKDINLLQNSVLGDYSKNGKLYDNIINHNIENELNSDNIMIGLHTDVRATYKRPSGYFKYISDGPIIDQVFTSTCISANKRPTLLQQKLLISAYEGTYLSAIQQKSTRLVLTIVGGGYFRNNMELIINIIGEVHEKYAQFLPDTCEVHLPIYVPCEYKKIVPILKKKTNIEVISYS